MPSGFEVLGHNRALQLHWARRFGAYAVDAVAVLMPTWTVLALLGAASGIVFLGVASGVVFVLYGTAAEALHGQTLGKYVFDLEVRPVRGSLTLGKSAARNAPKFFWYLFPLLDAILGLLGQGDPRQRFSDRILGTVVVQGKHATIPEGKGRPQHFHSEINCRACGGVLQAAGDSLLQCQACGLLQ